MTDCKTKVDIVIPSYKPDGKFLRLLNMLQKQNYPIGNIFVINTNGKSESFSYKAGRI